MCKSIVLFTATGEDYGRQVRSKEGQTSDDIRAPNVAERASTRAS